MRKMTFLAALAAVAVASPAAAQSWGFGVQVGPSIYYEEPPVYFGPPPVYYGAPAVHAPAMPVPVLRGVSPDEVFDALEAAGYGEFSTMQRRGALYRLTAVDPNGDLVALDISILSGEIERSSVLEARYAAPPPPARRAIAPPAPAARPAPVRKVAPVPAAAPRKPAASKPVANPPAATTAPAAGGSTLRDRLHTPPSAPPAPEESEDDPLVVY